MRQIKFRAWNAGCFSMVSATSIQEMIHQKLNTYPLEKLNNNFIFMQFTGLTDKNGADIYEGDIVEWLDGDSKEKDKGIIEWDNRYAGFGITGEHCLDWNHMLEIIGNIHQNPELLK